MDRRRWQWKNPWKKNMTLCTLLFLTIAYLQCASAGEQDYQQELKDKHPDPNKLDTLSKFLPYDLGEDSDYKRASSFFPLRGKKTPSDDELFMSKYGDYEDKRAQFFPLRGKKVPDDLKRASYFMPMRGKKGDNWMDEYDVTDEVSSKRASSFMPMRGKKKYASISDYLSKAGTYLPYAHAVVDSSNSQNQVADKRMQYFVPVRGKRSLKEPTEINSDNSLRNDITVNHSVTKRSASFLPMRGRREFDETPGSIVTSLLQKKSQENEYSGEYHKKAAGFMPMRGRKSEDSSIKDWDETKRAQSFMPMRGRRAELRDVVYSSAHSPEVESKLIEEKRASSFMPMRGKRSIPEPSHEDDAKAFHTEKKASSFMPMRGRRSVKNEEEESQNDSDKRTAFMPMRGRRLENGVVVEPLEQLYTFFEKKASAFMPMRGRKFDDEVFTVSPWAPDQLMPLLNKKSAFVPMRGRKYDDETFTVAPWTPDQLMPLLDKKSSAFMPMRGRRYDDEMFTVAPWTPDQLMPLLDKKSTAFMPMRGRRYDDETFTVAPWSPDQLMPLLDKRESSVSYADRQTDQEHSEELNKNAVDKSSIMPIRERRLETDQSNFYNPYTYLMAGIGSSLMSKPYIDRGVTFSSVSSPQSRRKKLRINWDAVKRAFHASRGKRFEGTHDSTTDISDSESKNAEEINETSSNDSDNKNRRKRSIIRPRGSTQASRTYLALKRPMSFFATRGKRLDDSAIDNFSQLR